MTAARSPETAGAKLSEIYRMVSDMNARLVRVETELTDSAPRIDRQMEAHAERLRELENLLTRQAGDADEIAVLGARIKSVEVTSVKHEAQLARVLWVPGAALAVSTALATAYLSPQL